QKHVRGSLAMARSQHPDSAGSQFYITDGPTPHLDNNYTGFGKVTSGLEHLDRMMQGDRMWCAVIVEAGPLRAGAEFGAARSSTEGERRDGPLMSQWRAIASRRSRPFSPVKPSAWSTPPGRR